MRGGWNALGVRVSGVSEPPGRIATPTLKGVPRVNVPSPVQGVLRRPRQGAEQLIVVLQPDTDRGEIDYLCILCR